MEIKEMAAADLEARKAELAGTDLETLASEELNAIETEARAINEELEERAAVEAKKQEVRDMLAAGKTPEAEVTSRATYSPSRPTR